VLQSPGRGLARGVRGGLLAQVLGHCVLVLGARLRQLQGVVGVRHQEAKLAKPPLAREAPVLRGLHLRPPGLKLPFGVDGQLAGLGQPPLERLDLRGGPAMRVARLAPLLPDDAAAQDLEPRRGLGRLARRGRLQAQHLEPWCDLGLQVLEPQQVLRELREPQCRLAASRLDPAHLGGLLEQLPALGRRAHDDRLDVVLVDDRVRVQGQARGREQVQDVAAADSSPVEEVVAFAVALHAARDRDLVVVDRQAAGRVVEDDAHLGERGARAALAAGVDDLFHLPATQVARLARAEDPLDGVDDVRLPRAVGADDRGDPAFEADLGRPRESFEP